MTNGKPVSRIASEKDFNYAFDKLNNVIDKCDNSALEWVMASIRSNEKALCKGEITENTYMDRQQKVTSLVADFQYNCRCSPRSQVQML